jgi:hypothetical protein
VDFGNVSSAARHTFEEKLPDMEIILRYDSNGAEIGLSVLAEWCLLGERALRPAPEPGPPAESLSVSPSSLASEVGFQLDMGAQQPLQHRGHRSDLRR